MHKEQAIAMWGAENYDNKKRKMAKILNFSILYGANAYTTAEKFEISVEEAQEIHNRYWKAVPYIKSFQDRCVKKAKKQGYIQNFFGRPRRVKYWFNSPDYKDHGFAKRTVGNCYSEDTEFLTEDGWKLSKDITKETKIAYYIPDTDSYDYVEAGEPLYNYTKEAISFKGMNTDLLVTPNHRMYSHVNGDSKGYQIIEAKDLYDKKFFKTLNSVSKSKSIDIDKVTTPIGDIDIDTFLKFIGIHITDGSLVNSEGHGYEISISQTKDKNILRLDLLNQDLNNFFNKCSYDRRGKTEYSYRKCHKEMFNYLVDFYGGRIKSDRSLPKWVLELPKEKLSEFIEYVRLGDGTGDTSGSIYHPSKKLIDQLQIIMMDLSYRTHINEIEQESGKILYRLCFTEDCRESTLDKRYNYSRESYDEERRFVCYSVPTGLLVVRRNGKISVCGNTMIQSIGGDMLRIVFIKTWKQLFNNPKYKDKCRFLSTIHN